MLYQGSQSSSRAFLALMFVLVLHVFAVIAFKSGLIQQIIPVAHKPTPIAIDFIEEKKPPPPPPPVQPVVERRDITLPPIAPPDLPPLENVIDIPIPTGPLVGPVSDPPVTGEGPQMVVEFQPDGRFPLTKPEYPWQSIRMNEQGSVTLLIYVMPNGRVGEVKVQTSSGHRRLDESAMREARRSWRFLPRTVGGQAIASWGTYKVRFRLD